MAEERSAARTLIWLVEDSKIDYQLIARGLEQSEQPFDLRWFNEDTAVLTQLAIERPDVLILDLVLHESNGLETFEKIVAMGFDIPTVFVTGRGNELAAVQAIKLGAADYIVKDIHSEYIHLLPFVVRRALAERQARQINLEAEQQLLQQAKLLARSNKELQQFAYAVSHDLQAPLRRLNAYAQFLRDDNAELLSEDSRQFLDGISENVNLMSEMIQALLAFSRIEQQDKEKRVVDLNQLVEQIIEEEQLDQQADIKMAKKLPTVWANWANLEQLLRALLRNAVQYRRLDVASEIMIAAREAEAFWEVTVADNGQGISERHHEQIFDVFFRLHSYEQYRGIGMGLAIARKVVESEGGKIWVESQLGQGARFTFTIVKQKG